MKKTVSFTKNLEFPMQIGEITQINLEEDLKFINENNVEGKFLITGKYKMTEASRLEEDFSFSFPVEIVVSEKCDLDTCKISITDFNYEIVDEDILRANINVLIEAVEVVDDEEVERECDDDSEKEKEIPKKEDVIEPNFEIKEEKIDYIEEKVEEENTKLDIDSDTDSLFSNLNDDKDSFSTYSIYIMREGDTLEKVMEKYSITKEKLEEYNDISTITLNSKIVIPSVKNE